MWRRIGRHRSLRAISFIFMKLFLIRPVATEIALTALPLWTSADPCARACVSSLSSSYSASASCPSQNVAGCLCPSAGHSVASVAHNCAFTTCWTLSTYTEAPAYARILFSSYCEVNDYAITTTTDSSAAVATTPSAGQKISIDPTSPVQLSTTSTSSSSSTQALNPSSSTNTATTSNESPRNSSNTGSQAPTSTFTNPSHGAKVGIGVGVGLGGPILLAALYFLIQYLQKKKIWSSHDRSPGTGKGFRGRSPSRVEQNSTEQMFMDSRPSVHASSSHSPTPLNKQVQSSNEPAVMNGQPVDIFVCLSSGEKIPARALLDSGATGDYVSNNWLVKTARIESLLGAPIRERRILVNGDDLEIIGSISLSWRGEMDGEMSRSCFNVIECRLYDFIIGKETLAKEEVFIKNPNAKVLRDCPPHFTIVDG